MTPRSARTLATPPSPASQPHFFLRGKHFSNFVDARLHAADDERQLRICLYLLAGACRRLWRPHYSEKHRVLLELIEDIGSPFVPLYADIDEPVFRHRSRHAFAELFPSARFIREA